VNIEVTERGFLEVISNMFRFSKSQFRSSSFFQELPMNF